MVTAESLRDYTDADSRIILFKMQGKQQKVKLSLGLIKQHTMKVQE
jgi:hypothetical protein